MMFLPGRPIVNQGEKLTQHTKAVKRTNTGNSRYKNSRYKKAEYRSSTTGGKKRRRGRAKRRLKPLFRQAAMILVLLLVALVIWRQLPYYIYPDEYSEIIEEAAGENGIDPYLVSAVIKVESNFNADAVSAAGAVGLMQIMPDTAEWLATLDDVKSGESDLSESDLREPEYNIRLGCRYLRFLLDRWDWNIYEAVASYNAGQTNVARWLADGVWDGTPENLQDIPYEETRRYVDRVFGIYREYLSLY